MKPNARLALTIGLFAATTSVQAQSTPGSAPEARDASQDDQVLTQIVVTAQRVSEPLQRTPASISVLTADMLQTAGVRDLGDVSHLIPNLTFTDGYRAGVPNISLRGIPTVQGGDPPAAFVVDGVQVPALDFVNQELLDISNVQVLRGPQGGIYGRDAIGGAVIIETERPTNDFHDTVTADAGNGEYFRAVNTVSGPIVTDKLWAKLTLAAHYYGGLIQNIDLHEPVDSIKDYAGRAEILTKPTGTTTLDFTYAHTQGIEGASYQAILPNYAIGDFKQYQPDFNQPLNDRRYIDTYSVKVDQATPLGTLTSVSQYAQTESTVFGDADWTPAPIVTQWNAVGVKAINEDLHLSSSAGQLVQWIVGGFYQLRQTENNLNVFFQQVPGGNPICGCAGGPNDSVLLDDDHNSSLERALYGQMSVPLPADFKFDLALRYDSDRRADEDRSIPAGPHNSISETFGSFQPNGTLSRQFTPDIMGYVTVGKGFRSGGFNAYTDSVASGQLVAREFPAETDVNYEAGMKSTFLDHRLTVNADVFHTHFNNEQYYLVNTSPPARDVVTIRSVDFNGGELEVDYLPVAGLTLTAAAGLADSKITSHDFDQNDFGKQSPQANKYTANVAAQYRQPLGSDYGALYRLDYSYKGPICYDSANVYCFHAVGFLDARVGLENRRYTFSIWGRNIANVREPINFGPNSMAPGVSTQMVNEPATYGVEVIARF